MTRLAPAIFNLFSVSCRPARGDDVKPGIQGASRKSHVNIGNVRIGASHQSPGSLNPSLPEDRVRSGITNEVRHSLRLEFAYGFRLAVDDHIGDFRSFEIRCHLVPHPPEAAYEVVVSHFHDPFVHLPSRPIADYFALDDDLHSLAGSIESRPDTRHGNEHSQDSADVGERVDFLKAYGGQGDYHHVGRFEKSPALNEHETRDADSNNNEEDRSCRDESSEWVHVGASYHQI